MHTNYKTKIIDMKIESRYGMLDYDLDGGWDEYTRPEKHFIYPKYEVFEKVLAENNKVEIFTNKIFERLICSAIIAQMEEKPVDLLTDEEKLGVYIGAGIPLKYENGKMITLYGVNIDLVDKKYKVSYKIPKLNNTYC